jgi:hypothetical protein
VKEAGNAFGLVIGLAIVSVIAYKPNFLKITFSGAQGLINAATLPVRGK